MRTRTQHRRLPRFRTVELDDVPQQQMCDAGFHDWKTDRTNAACDADCVCLVKFKVCSHCGHTTEDDEEHIRDREETIAKCRLTQSHLDPTFVRAPEDENSMRGVEAEILDIEPKMHAVADTNGIIVFTYHPNDLGDKFMPFAWDDHDDPKLFREVISGLCEHDREDFNTIMVPTMRYLSDQNEKFGKLMRFGSLVKRTMETRVSQKSVEI